MSAAPAPGRVAIGDFEVGNDLPLALIAGPCAIEGRDHALRVSETLVEMTAARGVPFVYKSSFDKANRTSGRARAASAWTRGSPSCRRCARPTAARC